MSTVLSAQAGAPVTAKPSARVIAQRRAGIWLAAPAALLLFLLVLLPSSAVLLLSLTDYQLGLGESRFVGADNYAALVSDPAFRQSLLRTAIYVATVAPVSIGLGLIFALKIEARTTLKAWYRTAFFLPVTATLVAMATAWEVLYHPTFGLLNTVLALAGFQKVRFLADPGTALFAVAAIGVWKQVGFNLILFLAGLSTIPRDLYEAASIDGADGGWRRFLLVSWPMLGPVTLFIVVITLIRAVSEFETVAVLTDGGPVGSTRVILFMLYEEAFRYLKIGTGSAIAVMFLVCVALLTLLQMRLAEKKVHYV